MAGVTTTVRIPGLVLTEHEFRLPLDHDRPDGEQLTVSAREVAAPDGADRPYLVFLQGGPGQEAPRPSSATGWIGRAVREYRVLLLDQRGTGNSSPVGTLPGLTPREQAEYLTHFRADSIVRDAEAIRTRLGVDRWSVLGQSFGGFCALHYLCAAPSGLARAYFTGGLPPVGRHPDEVYTRTFGTQLERNRRYYRRYPTDRGRVRAVHERIAAGELRLPEGSALTTALFRQLGNVLGMSDGAERLHFLLERDPGSPAFAHDLAAALPFSARNPLYAVVHESSYADGGVTGWSAQRVLPADFAADPTLFTGEHVFPSTISDLPGLAPLAEAAQLLAEHEWPRLYSAQALRECTVPCVAAVYAEDPYVDRAFSEEAAALIPTMRTWLTNEFEHDGLRTRGEQVLGRLIDMAHGRA